MGESTSTKDKGLLNGSLGKISVASRKVTPSVHSEQGYNDDSKGADTPDIVTTDDQKALISTNFLIARFCDPALEHIYQEYVQRIRRRAIYGTILTVTLFNIYAGSTALVSYDSSELTQLIILGVSTLLCFALFLLARGTHISETVRSFLPYVCWLQFLLTLCLDVWLNSTLTLPSESLGWQVLMNYGIFVVLPLSISKRIALFFLSSVIMLAVVISLPVGKAYGDSFNLAQMVGASLLLYACAAVLGLLVHYFTDRKLRISFLETKGSLSVNLEMEESSKEQRRLLLSVLPKHVADEMVKDMGSEDSGQFRKIYMNRHENVSILFADIVGFTALSSQVTARQLVRILNDLFATFDKLAHRYHQLRIKILGDCYYSISGCPTPRSDHAVLCIHMGLAMVEAISYVREKTKSGVNMRVGIHTGAVLGGVLGQNRWQYDVLGKEVTLANRMESGGVAGRVHISETSASFLQGEFELEPGEGDTREEGIKMAGIKTYLIKSVLKAYPEGTLDAKKTAGNGHVTVDEETEISEDVSSVKVAEKEMTSRLFQALMEREDKTHMSSKLNSLTLSFKDAEFEREYGNNRQKTGGMALMSLTVVSFFCFLAQLCILPKNVFAVITFAVSEAILVLISVITLSTSFKQKCPGCLVSLGVSIERNRHYRIIWAVLAVAILVLSNLIDLFSCDNQNPFYKTIANVSSLDPNSQYCEYPTFYWDFAAVSVMGVCVLVQVDYILKALLMTFITTLYCVIILVFLPNTLRRWDDFVDQADRQEGQASSRITLCVSLISITLSTIYISRLLDRLWRKLFYYRHEVEELQQQIGVIREKNQALIYNILPAHVAKDFIGSNRRDEELYSQHHDEVGVMFAACPNFNDFYTEDAVNNNGLECIRVLNEILSDYDDLLKDSRFYSVIKIKTVGSTYMAASGMNMDRHIAKDAPVVDRWQHLADLVEFAFAMKEALDKINSQSFNNFMLRIGLNQGPLLAGVIGARKPHYDIWSNTVNVASRMESTGQLGKIQVVEETMEILKEFGYKFQQRGLVKVKGKGDLMTYFLLGKDSGVRLPNQVAAF